MWVMNPLMRHAWQGWKWMKERT
uniref:Uncharacterized protein n=1 Tax=Arundo donax TaxID=35708 RepID=A0A0A8ZG47_ARUDO